MMQEIIEEINRSQDSMLQDKVSLEVKQNDLKHDIPNIDKIIKTVIKLTSDTIIHLVSLKSNDFVLNLLIIGHY